MSPLNDSEPINEAAEQAQMENYKEFIGRSHSESGPVFPMLSTPSWTEVEKYRVLNKDEMLLTGDEVQLNDGRWVPFRKSAYCETFCGTCAARRPIGNVPGPGIGIGGAPTRATTLPEDPAERKRYPIASGVLDYFPDALVAIAHVSQVGNEQHNPGQPLNWARSKSADESDTMMRHFVQRGTLDKDGLRHTAKMAWRALALLQKEIEAEKQNQ